MKDNNHISLLVMSLSKSNTYLKLVKNIECFSVCIYFQLWLIPILVECQYWQYKPNDVFVSICLHLKYRITVFFKLLFGQILPSNVSDCQSCVVKHKQSISFFCEILLTDFLHVSRRAENNVINLLMRCSSLLNSSTCWFPQKWSLKGGFNLL